MEKQVHYSHTNSYSTLNTLGEETTHIWWTFHGMGYLSRYFLKYFKSLPPQQHYIIAPQAPSKYYLNDTYTRVGACWLTKEATEEETLNLYQYLDAVFENEIPSGQCKLMVMGFSQGVSIALRWLVEKQRAADHLILYAGGIPNELTPEDVAFLIPQTRITVVYGNEDPYLNEERLKLEGQKINKLFKDHAQILKFNGGHEIKDEVLQQLLQ